MSDPEGCDSTAGWRARTAEDRARALLRDRHYGQAVVEAERAADLWDAMASACSEKALRGSRVAEGSARERARQARLMAEFARSRE